MSADDVASGDLPRREGVIAVNVDDTAQERINRLDTHTATASAIGPLRRLKSSSGRVSGDFRQVWDEL
jgi:hypothetical protein